MSATAPMPFGRYVLLEKIAVGGMAEIFKAQYRADKDFEKILVIKRILPNLATNDEFITMFRDEAKVNVRLTHANIVQVFDFGREGDDYYLAMEYVQGQNVRRVLKRALDVGSAALPIPFALYVAHETAKGLAYAHTRKDDDNRDLGIIHRDVTPSNILVSYEGEVKITDFGIAKAASKTSSTQQGMVKGKVPYLAPEQLLAGKTPDARLDVFALGAVTWEMLTGKRLVPGETDVEILAQLVSGGPFPAPSEIKPTISAEIDRVVMKALARNPDERYASAAAYQKELALLVSRFVMTSVEAATFMRRLFQAEIDAERTRSRRIEMPVVDPGLVTQGAEQEATATRTRPATPAAPPLELELGENLPTNLAEPPPVLDRRAQPQILPARPALAPAAPVATFPPPPRNDGVPLRGVVAWIREALRSLVAAEWESPERNALIAWAVFYSLYGIWIFARFAWSMPLLVTANVFLHEAGHPAFGVFGHTAAAYGGTIFQLGFPVIALVSFFSRRQMPGVAFCLFWLGANFAHVGVYMADARAGELPLLGGGEHDFEFIFGQLGLLEWDTTIGALTRLLGWTLMASAPALMVRYFFVQRRGAAARVSLLEPAPLPRSTPRSGKRWGSE